ncbi:MAG TPA: LptF/LptG family permease, partial [Sphingomonas sp.]|nr:LptF/LptG family permease [Sphingomonas sp.]
MTHYMLRFFPSRTLAFYMARTFLIRAAGVLVLLVVVLQALDLLGESGDILAYPGNGQAQILHYLALRLPQIVARFLPFSVLLGTLITLVSLNQHSEVIAMKAGGVSAHQILAPLVIAGLGVAALSFAFNERVVTRATAALSAWQDVNYGPVPTGRHGATNIWVRDGDDIIHAASASGHGAGVKLNNLTVFDRNGGELVRVVSAASAVARLAPPQEQGGPRRIIGWTAANATLFDINSG